jgi:hypothetical protein
MRRVFLERLTYERSLEATRARPISEDRFGKLYRIATYSGESLAFVQVTNSTPDADGTHRHYLLRVPPSIGTAREAVAWTFRSQPNEYRPTLET